MDNLLKPKTIDIKDLDGVIKKFQISRLPAMLGRKIATQYAMSLAPKVGDYALNEALCVEMLSYTNAVVNGKSIPLDNIELINQQTGDWETLKHLEREMIAYNTSFLVSGDDLTFSIVCRGLIREFLSVMSTDSPEQS